MFSRTTIKNWKVGLEIHKVRKKKGRACHGTRNMSLPIKCYYILHCPILALEDMIYET